MGKAESFQTKEHRKQEAVDLNTTQVRSQTEEELIEVRSKSMQVMNVSV
jgi:hypothetical protein